MDSSAKRAEVFGDRLALAVVLVTTVLASAPKVVLADGAIERARAFLTTAQQQPGGDFPGIPIIDTAEAVAALEAGRERDAALFALSLARPDNTEAALARAAALSGTPFADLVTDSALRAALIAEQLGLAPSSVGIDGLVLAKALHFAATQVDGVVLAGGLMPTAVVLQHPDGGFGFADNDSDLVLTTELARALRRFQNVASPALLSGATTWLLNRINTGVADLGAADLALLILGAGDQGTGITTALIDALLLHQDSSGAFDGDVRATALAVQALKAGLPDLAIAMAPIQSEAVTGASASAKLRVTNSGRIPAPATTLQAVVQDAGGVVLSATSVAVPELASGATTTVTADLGIQGALGARTATFVVNGSQAFAESDYANNVLSWSYTVKDQSDLVIEPADIALDPDPAVLYQSSRIAVRVRNIGQATAQDVHVQLFEGDPLAGGKLMGEAFFNTVVPGTPRVLMVNWTSRDLDPHTFVARIDPEERVAEKSETNNQASVTFTAKNPADFIVDLNTSLSTTANTLNQGDTLVLSFGVGGLISRFGHPYPDPAQWPFHSVPMVLYQGTPGVQGVAVWSGTVGLIVCTGTLNPMTVCHDGYPWLYQYKVNTNAVTGTFQYTLVLDPDNLTQDVNRANNVVVKTVEIQNPGLAELWVDPASLRSDPPVILTGGTSIVHATVGNTGVVEASNVRVDLVLPSITRSVIVPTLVPGQTGEVQYVVASSDLQLGNNGQVVVDPLNAIQEASKANNTATISLRSGNANYAFNATTSPSPAPADQTVDLIVSLRNTGTNAFSPGYINVTIGAQHWYQNDTSALQPGEAKDYHFAMSTVGMKGQVEVGYSMQHGTASTKLNIANADFAVSPEAIALEPSTGNVVAPVVTVNNLGNLTAPTSIRIYRGYPEQGDLASSGSISVVAGGSAVWRGPTFAASDQAPFVVSVILDEEKAATELDETNNFATVTAKARSSLVVVFDETHGPSGTVGTNEAPGTGGWTAGLTDFAKDLEARGYHVITADPDEDGLTPNKLLADVVVEDAPSLTYSAYELQLLRTFVERGGGIFLLGDYGDPVTPTAWQPVEDQLTQALGFSSVHAFVFAGGQCSVASQIFNRSEGAVYSHPITSGVNTVLAQYVGGFANLPADAQVLVQSPAGWQVPNVIVAGTFPLGTGRVGFHGDANLMDADFSAPGTSPYCQFMYDLYRQANNRRFALQMIDWLTKAGPRDWLPDLAFSPAHLALDKDPITGGDVVTVSGRVRNIGGWLPIETATVVRVYDGSSVTGKLLFESPLPALADGEPFDFSFSWDTTGFTEQHTLTAVIDPDGLVTEYSEENNVLIQAVPIRAAVDLRVDTVDVSFPQAGGVAVRVHNLGYSAVASGATQVVITDDTGQRVAAALPAVPALGAATVTVPWSAVDPTVQQRFTIAVDPSHTLTDLNPDNQTASITVVPPRIELYSPIDGAVWGGTKTIRWSVRSDEFPDATVNLAFGAADGPLSGQFLTKTPPSRPEYSFAFDSTRMANGMYRVRIAADAGVVKGVREVLFRIDNSGTALRTFATGQTTTPAIGQPGGTAQLSMPVGVLVDSATALLDVQEDPSVAVPGRTGGSGGNTTLTYTTDRWLLTFSDSSGALMTQTSVDGGLTWSAPIRASLAGQVVGEVLARRNGWGFHIFYTANSGQYYARSADGLAWTTIPMFSAPNGTLGLSVRDDGLTLVPIWAPYGSVSIKLYSAPPDGSSWSTPIDVPGFTSGYPIQITVAQGKLRFYQGVTSVGIQYREALLSSDLASAASYSVPITVTAAANDFQVFDANGRIEILTTVSGYPNSTTYLQRCRWSSDCTRLESWLPSAPVIANGSPAINWRNSDQLQLVWNAGQATALTVDGGERYGRPIALDTTGSEWSIGDDSIALMILGTPVNVYRWPGFAPTQSNLDFGADGVNEWADTGPRVRPVAPPDFAAALNSYLATHADADDGVVDNQITIPVSLGLKGLGKLVLRNLEIRYRPLSAVAAYAEPPLISPQESPGLLDSSLLSIVDPGNIVVVSSSGQPVRTLATAPVNGRSVALFDGRDELGAFLPSGVYWFGPAAAGWLEIDDILPTAAISSGAEGAYGGRAPIYGTATDSDYAASSKNFSRYVLEYTLDGITYSSIATGTTPIVNGLLGTWDTRVLAQGAATLRLTVYDRAGNSTSTTRGVNVSPGAPQAPVIDRPAVAGAPVDSLSSIVAVSGSAEPNTSVTVFLNSVAVGTTSSDGRWTLSGVNLPSGITTITASATRNSLESPRSRPIEVANYSLAVAISAPAHAIAGSDLSATVTATRTSVQATPLTIRVSATDSTGKTAPIGLSPSQQIVTFAGLGSASFPVTISTKNAPPGTYQLTAEVISGGLIPATGSTSLELDPAMSLSATLASDKAIYDALQVVSLSSRIFNTGNNPGSSPLSATIAVNEPTGPVVVLGPFSVASIPTGQFATLSTLFGAPPLPVGVYVADLYVDDATGTRVATATTSFEVQPANGAGELAGTLLVTPVTYVPGDVLSAAFTVTNSGGDAQVPVTVMLLDQVTSAIVARSDQLLTIPHGSTVPGTATLSTQGAVGNELIALLIGNGRGLAGQAIAPSPIHDTTPPVITIAGVSQDEYRSGTVTPVITVTDSESPFTWQAKLNDQPFTSGTEITNDSEYVLVVNAEDIYGNAATEERRFTIDTIAPVVDVSGVAAGDMRRDPVTPEVAFSDLHLRNTSLTLDGQPFTSGTILDIDGDYTLVAFADDLADNSTTVTVPFTIDRTPPLISISGVSDGELTNLTVFPVVQVTEPYLASESELLDGLTWDGLPVVPEGDHVLDVQATDLAGNASQVTVHFVIDKTPPVILIAGVADGQVTQGPVVPVITVTDPHSPTYTATLNGQPFASGSTVLAEGTYQLLVQAADAAGNQSSPVTVHFAIDQTGPAIEVTGVTDGQVTRGPVVPVITVTDPCSPTYTATLNGQSFTSGSSVAAEGEYDLAVHAADCAGNTSHRQLHFAVDLTPPAITVSGVTEGLITNQTVSPVVSVTDAHLASQAITLDGSPFVSGTAVHVEGDHLLHAEAADTAGNTAAKDLHFTQDFTLPEIRIEGVVDGGVYHQPVTPTFSAADLHTPTVSATLDGVPFQSGTIVQTNGAHTLLVTAQDAAGNTASASATFSVQFADGSLVLRFDESPRVLVALDCQHHGGCGECHGGGECHEDHDGHGGDCHNDCGAGEHYGDHGQSQKSQGHGDPSHGDPHHHHHHCEESAAVLLGALRDSHIPYEVTKEDEHLEHLFRQHRHNVLILYRSDSDEEHLAAEIREATYAGDGLVVVNTPPADADPKLELALGIDFLGKLNTVGQVILQPSDLSSGGVVTITGSGIVQRLEGATAAGATASGKVVLSTYRYGSGRSVTFTFDPELNGTSPQVAELLVSAVRFAAGGQQPEPIPGSPQYLEFVAHLSAGGPLDFQLTATLANGLQVVEAPLATSLDPVTWLFTLPSGESAERHLTVTAAEVGSYRVGGLLTALVGGQPFEVGVASLDVEYPVSLEELQSRAEAAVSALSGTGRDRALKADALQHLSQIRLPPRCGGDGEESIEHVLKAIADVRQMSAAGAPAALGPLEELLRAVEVVSTTFSHR